MVSKRTVIFEEQSPDHQFEKIRSSSSLDASVNSVSISEKGLTGDKSGTLSESSHSLAASRGYTFKQPKKMDLIP